MDAATSILRKTAPTDVDETLSGIKNLLGQTSKDTSNSFSRKINSMLPFRSFVDIPEDDTKERPFLLCHYNQTENSHRSPWTNRYFVNSGGNMQVHERDIPPDEQEMRALEKNANEVWESYVQLYYGKEAIGSVFLKSRGNPDSGAFEGLFGVQKKGDTGAWNSVHLVTVEEPSEKDKTCDYAIESAAYVSLVPWAKTDVGCSLQKETSKTCKVRFSSLAGSHLENLGRLIEDIEIDFRSRMERVDIPKTMEVIESVYRKHQGSKTAHLISGGSEYEGSHATGMGVGSGMIGEIASRAKAKGLGSGEGASGNPFMAALNSKLQKQNTEKAGKDGKETGGQYNSMKSQLKKNPNPLAGEAMAALNKRADVGGDKLNDLKAGLKKRIPGGSQKSETSSNPTPEFMDFRSKLKKSTNK